MSPTRPLGRTRFIGSLAVTLIRLAPEYPSIRRGLLRAVAREHPDATMGDLHEALRVAIQLLDEQAREPIAY